MSSYKIKRLDASITEQEFLDFMEMGRAANAVTGDRYNWDEFPLGHYLRHHYVALCYFNGVVSGIMVGQLMPAAFDNSIKILKQLVLRSVTGQKTAYLLLKDFIDFGKNNANDIITNINSKTNIKESSLAKLGFKPLEMQYRLEVKNE